MKSTAIYLDGELIGEYGAHPNSERHAWGPMVRINTPIPKKYLKASTGPRCMVRVGGEVFDAHVIYTVEDGREIITIEHLKEGEPCPSSD